MNFTEEEKAEAIALATGTDRATITENAEAKAFMAFKEVMDAAFKCDGMRGVIDTTDTLSEGIRELTQYLAQQGIGHDAQGVMGAEYVSDEFAPEILQRFKQIEAGGGFEAVKAAKTSK